jgi:hypothetical protein
MQFSSRTSVMVSARTRQPNFTPETTKLASQSATTELIFQYFSVSYVIPLVQHAKDLQPTAHFVLAACTCKIRNVYHHVPLDTNQLLT